MGFLLSPLIGIALNGVTLWIVTSNVEGVSYTGGLKFFLLGGLILGLINFFVKPILKAISLPLIMITGGLFYIVVNVFILWFLSYFLDTLAFRDVTLAFAGAGSYVIGAIVFGLVNWVTNLFFK